MSQEWYLLASPHALVSGYESEALTDFAQEGFLEQLDSDFAEDIELYNYDLSECTKMKAIIQNKVQDTKLKTLNRELYVPIGTCKAGMYVKYKNRYWLIVGLVDDNKMYEKAIMVICNHLLTWKKGDKIFQRWANITSASQYNSGETPHKFYTLRTDQLLVLLPDDDDSLMINEDNRFIIDKRCKVYEKQFSSNTTMDISNPVITYRLTRPDSVLYDYQGSGFHQFLAYQDEQHEGDGYYVVNGTGYWLCGEVKETDQRSTNLEILSDTDTIFKGLEPVAFIAKFYDEHGDEADVTPIWTIDCDFADQLDIEYVDNSVFISANSKKLINKSFELSLSAERYETVTKVVTIKSFI